MNFLKTFDNMTIANKITSLAALLKIMKTREYGVMHHDSNFTLILHGE